jgi:hypothetical protein
LDPGLFESDTVGERLAANGNQNLLGFELLLLAVNGEGDGHSGLGLLDLFHLRIYVSIDATLAIDTRQFLRDFFILERHHAREHFKNGHFGIERAED